MESYFYASYKDPENRVIFDNHRLVRLFFRHSACKDLSDGHLLSELVNKELILPFSPLGIEQINAYRNHFQDVIWAIEPQKLLFHLLPEQQVFSMWKEAALNYLKLNQYLIHKGFILKDASASNFCMHEGKMKLMDHGSFDFYSDGDPWKAYGQFCRNYLYPLWLMSYKNINFKNFFHSFSDGFPETFVSEELGLLDKISLSYILHVYLPILKQKKNAKIKEIKKYYLPKKNLLNIHQHLYDIIYSLSLKKTDQQWAHYYSDLKHYTDEDIKQKENFIMTNIKKLSNNLKIIDIGCNIGRYSLLLKDSASLIASIDKDHDAVEMLYKYIKEEQIKNIIPIHDSFSRPVPSYGWNLIERKNEVFSIHYDVCLFLALYHHIRITDNIPAYLIFKKLSELCKFLIIEYVPPHDSKIIEINRTKEMKLDFYDKEFHNELDSCFRIIHKHELKNSRKLYFCENIRK